jgi:hypothetical protein
LDVEEVPGVVGFVAGPLVGLVGVLVVVVVLVVVLVVVGVLVEELLELLELVLELLELVVVWQSLVESRPTVEAPWTRFCSSVVLIVSGRFATELLSAMAALDAAPHWCEFRESEIDCS